MSDAVVGNMVGMPPERGNAMGTDPEIPSASAPVRETTAHLITTLAARSEQLQSLFQTPPTGPGQNDSMILGLILELQKGQIVLSESILALGDRIERLEAAVERLAGPAAAP